MDFNKYVLNRKIGVLLKSKSIARRAGLRRMGCTQKVQMFKRIPRNPIDKYTQMELYVKQSAILRKQAKAYATVNLKNDLLF